MGSNPVACLCARDLKKILKLMEILVSNNLLEKERKKVFLLFIFILIS